MKNLAMHILDIAHNSIRAGATLIEIYFVQNVQKNELELVIKDNGDGMDKATLENVTDPYTTTRNTRKVGLGIPLLKQNAERCEGQFAISSAEKSGTMVNASFSLNHIDRPPVGDLVNTVVGLAAGTPKTDFIFTCITDQGEYVFKTREVKEVLEDTPISDTQVVKYLNEMVAENIKETCGIQID